MPDGTYRSRLDGEPIGGFCLLGSFADRIVVTEASCIPLPSWFPLDVAALLSCGIPTGWGSAEYLGQVRPGDTVVVIGSGGIGVNAVQGAAYLGASHVIVADPVELKREFALTMGATHVVASAAEAAELARQLSFGRGADVVIETVGVLDAVTARAAFDAVAKGGRLVLTGTADDPQDVNFQVPANQITFNKITIRGDLLGGCNAPYDVPRLARLFDEGHLKVRELISKVYTVDEVAQAYADVRDGKIIRGVVRHQHEGNDL